MEHGEHEQHAMGSTNAMAVSATLHCLTGCAIGEILGLVVGTALGLGNLATIVIAIALAFVFGYTTFWLSMMLALTVAFFAAWPVNRYLLARGKGHALTHGFHGATPAGARRWIPDLATPTLVAAITAFMLGGLLVSAADALTR